MPQKPLKAVKKIAKAVPSRHGKAPQTRKGKFDKPPKKGIELERYKDNKELTREINNTNETRFKATAEAKGGKLSMLKGAKPPALASKDKNARDKAAKRAAVAQHKEDDAAHDAAMAEAESDEDEELVEA